MHIVIYLRDQTPFQEGKNSAKEALKDTDWKPYLGKNVEDYKIAKKLKSLKYQLNLIIKSMSEVNNHF